MFEDENLDARTMELVVGWTPNHEENTWVLPDGKHTPVSQTPRVSSDIRLAMRLVEILRSRGSGEFSLHFSPLCAPCMAWKASIGGSQSDSDDPAKAICLAALKRVKEIETREQQRQEFLKARELGK